MTQELTVRQETALTPAEVVETSTIQSKLLMDIVEKTHCYQEIAGKKYLQVEAWETIGAFNRTHAETESINPITRGEDTVGYQARVQLWKDGIVVGGAVMPCFFTENCCKGKEGDAKHKSCMSAAQTFATSKAYRMNFSYVAILAGYQATPAEEMTGVATDDKPAKTQHWCEKHQARFFKKGRMKGYAHPIEGSDNQWCNEDDVKDEQVEEAIAQEVIDEMETPPEPESEPPQSKSDASPEKVEEQVEQEGINLDWLRENLEYLEGKGLKAWTRANVLSYLNTLTGQKNARISDAAKALDKEDAEAFILKVKEAVEMA